MRSRQFSCRNDYLEDQPPPPKELQSPDEEKTTFFEKNPDYLVKLGFKNWRENRQFFPTFGHSCRNLRRPPYLGPIVPTESLIEFLSDPVRQLGRDEMGQVPNPRNFVRFCGFSQMSICVFSVGFFSEKWLSVCVETAIPRLWSVAQWGPPPHKGIAGFTP